MILFIFIFSLLLLFLEFKLVVEFFLLFKREGFGISFFGLFLIRTLLAEVSSSKFIFIFLLIILLLLSIILLLLNGFIFRSAISIGRFGVLPYSLKFGVLIKLLVIELVSLFNKLFPFVLIFEIVLIKVLLLGVTAFE